MIVRIYIHVFFHNPNMDVLYHFSIQCDGNSMIHDGTLKHMATKNEAEVACIERALNTLLNSGITGITKVIINTE